MESENRTINLVRGIAIFFMLWGHCIQFCSAGQFEVFDNRCFQFIYSFHMPLFMLISGYLFFISSRKRSLSELVIYKSKNILYPLIMCTCFNFLLTQFIVFLMTENYINILSGVNLNSLWYLWSLFSCSVVLSFAIKTSKNIIIKILFIIFGLLFLIILPCAEMNVYMYPYFIIGYIISKFHVSIKRFIMPIGILSFVVFVFMFCFYNSSHLIYTTGLLGGETLYTSLCIDIFRWFIGLFGSLTVVCLSLLLYKFINRFILCKFLEQLGAHSLSIYTLSVAFLSFWLPILCKAIYARIRMPDLCSFIWIYNFVITVIIAFIYAVLLLGFTKLLKYLKVYKYIFGR